MLVHRLTRLPLLILGLFPLHYIIQSAMGTAFHAVTLQFIHTFARHGMLESTVKQCIFIIYCNLCRMSVLHFLNVGCFYCQLREVLGALLRNRTVSVRLLVLPITDDILEIIVTIFGISILNSRTRTAEANVQG